ncbi:MAG TPA: serine protease [Burkholderiales bacterium]|nr:serine protease [Burkholderiales bacterium]
MNYGVLVAVLALQILASADGAYAADSSVANRAPSGAADTVYEVARLRLLQIRTLLVSTGRQTSLGSAFRVSADGLAITNYHVISQFALEPATYRLEYAAPDGQRGKLKLLGFDVANDVALVQVDGAGQPYFEFDRKALQDGTPKGERLYSMGNPLDIGFTIVEGTYNGRVARSYNERVHFSGAINPGMSGGPAVSSAGRVVGVNVAKRWGGELISFLVPARFAAELVEKRRTPVELSATAVRAELGRQLLAWQEHFYGVLAEEELPSRALGPYLAPDSPARWFTCWARTNEEQIPRPRATLYTTLCNTETSLFISNDLSTGEVRVSHSYAKSVDLNAVQFAAFVSSQFRPAWFGWNRKRHTRTQCHEAFVAAKPPATPPLRAVWCARAYRDFSDLYDVSLLAVTQDRPKEALVSRLTMHGVSYANAMRFGERFLQEIRVAAEP